MLKVLKYIILKTPYVISNCDVFIKPNLLRLSLLRSYKYSNGNTGDYTDKSSNHENKSLS